MNSLPATSVHRVSFTVSLHGHPEGGELAAFLPAVPAEDPDRPLKARAAVASTG